MAAQNSSHLCINEISQHPKCPQELEAGHRHSECPLVTGIVTLFDLNLCHMSPGGLNGACRFGEGSSQWPHPVLAAALCLPVLHFIV